MIRIASKSFIVCLLALLLVSHAGTTIRQLGERVVRLRAGDARGVKVEFPLHPIKSIEAFLGIQYASLKGIGGSKLSFMPPSSTVSRWRNIRQCTQPSKVCPQDIRSMLRGRPDGTVDRLQRIVEQTKAQKEDCLFLNVYCPIPEWNDTEKFPVMIFVHGESYDQGTGNAYDGSVLASYGGVIVITVNYRLGVLGFLSTGDAHAEGNYALLDLLAILVWVKENIASFDGDANRVTLFGHGHGAALVNLLMFSERISDGLFNNVILQSGSAYSTWATSIDPVLCTKLLAKNVNCSHAINNSEALIKCFREKSWEDLIRNAPKKPKYYTCFAPSIGLDVGMFQSGKTLEELVKNKRSVFARKKVMFGITKKEAYSYLQQNEIDQGLSEARKSQILRTYVHNVYKCNKQKIFEILEHQYTRWDRPQNDETRRDDVMDLISDGQFKAPLIKMAQEHSKTADTYMYMFGYSTQSEDYPQWSGGVHGDELPYIFGAPLVDGISPFPSQYNSNEKELSKTMMRLWTNFAKTGDPNLPEHDRSDPDRGSPHDDIKWPKYNLSAQEYLQIGRRGSMSVKDFYRGQELALWMHLLPKINNEEGNGLDPTHSLANAENVSSFDDPERLIDKFYAILPSPPPLPPYSPPEQRDRSSVTTQDDVTDSTADYGPNQNVELTSKPNKETSTTVDKSDDRSTKAPGAQTGGVKTSSVPLSITVAIGASLLFLNLLIFAGVYYQRERIRKLRGDGDNNGGDSRMNRKSEQDDKTAAVLEASGMVQTVPDKQSSGKTVNLNHKSNVETNPIYSSISKPGPPPGGYSYSALSQKSSSPMHSNQAPTPTNGTQPTGAGPPAYRPGVNNVQRPTPTDGDRPQEMETRAKNMPRSNHQVTSNNAITIV